MDGGTACAWTGDQNDIYVGGFMSGTEKLKLPSGGWVDIKRWLSRGDRKQLNRLERQWLKFSDDVPTNVLVSNPDAAMTVDPSKVDPDAKDDLTMMLAIVAWSFEDPVTVEALDALDNRDVTAIMARLNELYLTDDEKKALGLKKD